ncbi:aldehyde dehydrogenase family protein [Hyphomonas neptunium ATCC 15444]|uniref:Aldehyde dehydrogenase family protein n=2 Tax=Hyphomonas TaxID=85 RepID=Q0C364_HYPNA|nr:MULTISPECIES: aldehyde dehydrogenase family protein [Hyphomonas]ABI78067.1 aldehyde dehydrogenase family protein [Hyphomonas neptunium ATCC 15444]KCZ95936.1 aldehyde dehydrogenase family protein [Hyphomonas hirschiana VP5]
MTSRTLPVRNPRTGELDYKIQAAGAEEIAATAQRLRAAQRDWAALPLTERGAFLLRLADALVKHRTAITAALEIDTGRRRIAGLELDGAVAALRGWVAQAPGLLPSGWTQGRAMPHIRHAPQFVPYALTGVISPWNFPLTLSMIDTIPALLAGSAVIIKPSEVTPRFAAPLMAAIAEAGLEDILTLIDGDGATGAPLIEAVDVICFTGSVATGRKVAAAAAAKMIPAFLELGGKDPLIVTATANLEHATDAALRGSVLSTGQACQSIERIYVAADIHDAFLKRLTEKAAATRLNWPDITTGELGPIIFDKQAAILADQIDDAKAKGARVLTGGEIETHGGGLWLKPTVLTNVSHQMKLMTEETFGPLLPVMPYTTTEEVIAFANNTEYGLSAAVFAGTLEEAEAIAIQIDAGAVSLNDAALTGLFHEAEKHSFKLSGLGGSRMGPAGFQRFLRRKALIANTGAPAPLSAFAEDAQ